MALSMNGIIVSGKVSMQKPSAPGYRYFRVNVNSYVGTEVRFSSVQIRVGLVEYPWQIAPGGMTSNNTPSPLVASAVSVYQNNANFLPFKAFVTPTGNASYRWIAGTGQATPVWLQIDLGAGNEITPTALRLCADDSGGSGYYVSSFTFLGSNTGAFAGEQATLYTSGTLTQGNWTNYGCNLFTF